MPPSSPPLLCLFPVGKTATHMQDPFEKRPADTAVITIARTIEIYLKELLGEGEYPETYDAGKFYQL